MSERGRPAVFLDRDGTLNAEVDFLCDPRDLRLLPGAAEAVRRLNEAGRVCVVVTNQSGIARGLLDEAQLAVVHAELERQLAAGGARLDALYHCPHHPDHGEVRECECRKPLPGLLRRAALDLELDLSASLVVGDSARDVEAGAALGVPGLLVESGKPLSDEDRARHEVVPDLLAAVTRLLDDGPQAPASSRS